MASRAVEMLLASRHEKSRLHRIVVRVGAASAWVATAVYLVVGAFTSDSSLLVEAVGPLLAASLMTIQIVLGREDGGVALFGSGLVVAIWYALFGDEGTIIPAALALILITSLAMLFVTNHRTTVAPTLAAALFGVAFLWDVTFDQRVVLGLIMSLSFAMTHFILSSIQLTSAAMSTRYQLLFEASPTAVLEEDWSESVEYVRSEYTGKPERIRQFLMAYPAVVERAVGKARVLRANEAAMSLLEVRSPARFLGYRDPRIVTDENMEGIVSALVSLYGGETTWESDIPTRVRSGEIRWLQSRSVDTSTGVPGTSIVVALADITHLKSRNEAMADLVKAKDEFIANVSHELRTPLTAVIGLTSELARDGALGESEREELLQLVAVQAAEMSNIVDDLLVAARAEMGTVPIDLQPVDLIGELKSTVGGLDVSVEMPEATTPRVVADPQRVRQILRNLLTNAQRYGGPLRRVAAGAEGGHAWLEVRDNGPGISADHANQIFEPYVTAHFGVQGSVGLGLAVARQLAELMGGSLTFERSQEESVFRLRLPLADRPEPALASHSNSL